MEQHLNMFTGSLHIYLDVETIDSNSPPFPFCWNSAFMAKFLRRSDGNQVYSAFLQYLLVAQKIRWMKTELE